MFPQAIDNQTLPEHLHKSLKNRISPKFFPTNPQNLSNQYMYNCVKFITFTSKPISSFNIFSPFLIPLPQFSNKQSIRKSAKQSLPVSPPHLFFGKTTMWGYNPRLCSNHWAWATISLYENEGIAHNGRSKVELDWWLVIRRGCKVV